VTSALIGTTGPHHPGSLTQYELVNDQGVSSDEQSNWAWCGYCQTLFYLPDIETSECAYALYMMAADANDCFPHVDGGSTNYQVYWVDDDVSGLQPGWNYCTSCRSLFHGSGKPTGACIGSIISGSGQHTPGATPYWVLEVS
jgi:hypothetical protein